MSVIHISHLDIGRYENYNIVTEVFCICLFKILNFFKLVYLKNLLNFELDVVCVPNQNHFKITFFLWIVLLLFQTKIVSYTTFWLTISKSDIKLETGTYPEAFIVKSIMRTTWLKQREPFTFFFFQQQQRCQGQLVVHHHKAAGVAMLPSIHVRSSSSCSRSISIRPDPSLPIINRFHHR